MNLIDFSCMNSLPINPNDKSWILSQQVHTNVILQHSTKRVCIHDSTTHKLPIPLPLSFLLIKQHKYDNRWDKANSYTVELSMPERAIFNALT